MYDITYVIDARLLVFLHKYDKNFWVYKIWGIFWPAVEMLLSEGLCSIQAVSRLVAQIHPALAWGRNSVLWLYVLVGCMSTKA